MTYRYITIFLRFCGQHPSYVPNPQLGAFLSWLVLKIFGLRKKWV
jgi:hypothetical protein